MKSLLKKVLVKACVINTREWEVWTFHGHPPEVEGSHSVEKIHKKVSFYNIARCMNFQRKYIWILAPKINNRIYSNKQLKYVNKQLKKPLKTLNKKHFWWDIFGSFSNTVALLYINQQLTNFITLWLVYTKIKGLLLHNKNMVTL